MAIGNERNHIPAAAGSHGAEQGALGGDGIVFEHAGVENQVEAGAAHGIYGCVDELGRASFAVEEVARVRKSFVREIKDGDFEPARAGEGEAVRATAATGFQNATTVRQESRNGVDEFRVEGVRDGVIRDDG